MRKTNAFIVSLVVLAVMAAAIGAFADLKEWKKLRFEVAGQAVPEINSMDEMRSLFTDPLVCSGCHVQHYSTWSNSYHARSIQNAGFQALFLKYLDYLGKAETREELGREATVEDLRQCLFCHAPQVQFASDSLVRQISDVIVAGNWEEIRGAQISCLVCHAMTPERRWSSDAFRRGGTLYGPLHDPAPQAMHGSQYSELHTRSEFCAVCHSSQTFNVFCSLVFEHSREAGATGQALCQDCHMKGKEGQAVAIGGKQKRTFHDHTAPGGRFREMWAKALDIDLVAEQKGEDELLVTVTVRSAIPHSIPDG